MTDFIFATDLKMTYIEGLMSDNMAKGMLGILGRRKGRWDSCLALKNIYKIINTKI